MFKAILLSRDEGRFEARVAELEESSLPAGTVQLAIEHSTLNFKDGLAITDRAPVVRRWPMVAGIDGAGVVEASDHPRWRPGDRVILNGWGAGETHWGCLAQRARLDGDWLVGLPPSLSTREAMAIGTAGYTAMLCVLALEEEGVLPGQGDILVTGAAGGVGSVAIALLAGRGYRVVASTGRAQETPYLLALGAAEVADRQALAAPGKPLQKERWAGVVDCVGSHTLANACAQARYGATVTACGLAQGLDLPGSVAPFILRAVRLVGIDSVMAPRGKREAAWAALAGELDRAKLASLTRVAALGEAIGCAEDLMAGRVRGRIVIDVNA